MQRLSLIQIYGSFTFCLLFWQDKSGVALVAHEKYSEPREVEVNSGVNHAVFFIMGVHTKPRWWIISGIGYISCQEGAGPCIQGESKDGCRSFGSKQAIYVYGFMYFHDKYFSYREFTKKVFTYWCVNRSLDTVKTSWNYILKLAQSNQWCVNIQHVNIFCVNCM